MIKIDPENFYSKTEILKLLGISEGTFGKYRQDLPTHQIGQEVYSQGKEIIEFILSRKGNEKLELFKKKK